jgi:hypothetical protein
MNEGAGCEIKQPEVVAVAKLASVISLYIEASVFSHYYIYDLCGASVSVYVCGCIVYITDESICVTKYIRIYRV